MPIETEIKLPWDRSLSELQDLLGPSYAQQSSRVLQIDRVYDRLDAPSSERPSGSTLADSSQFGELRLAGKLLRLRSEDDRWTVTYKGPAKASPHKSREEIETSVADGPAFEQILEALGYRITFRYEKYRSTFAAPGQAGLVTLDETPIGNYLELEGPGPWIDRMALQLGFEPADYVTMSYSALYERFRRQHPLVPHDMRF